jgi:hypothetical protein
VLLIWTPQEAVSYTAATMTAWFEKAFRSQEPSLFIKGFIQPLVAARKITFEVKK